MSEIQQQLKQGLQTKVDLACNPLASIGFSDFVMIILFNDGSDFILTNKSFFNRINYKKYLKYYPTTDSINLKEQEKISEDSDYHIVRCHAECSFVFIGSRDKFIKYGSSLTKKEDFEKFCIQFIDNLLELIIHYNPDFKHAFILNNKVLRDAVIKGGYPSYGAQQITSREQECLWHAAHGKSVKEIARSLQISNYTVEQHLRRIREAFNCSSLIEAIIEGIHRGIIGKINHYISYNCL